MVYWPDWLGDKPPQLNQSRPPSCMQFQTQSSLTNGPCFIDLVFLPGFNLEDLCNINRHQRSLIWDSIERHRIQCVTLILPLELSPLHICFHALAWKIIWSLMFEKYIYILCLTDKLYLNTIHHRAVLSASLYAVLYFTSASVTWCPNFSTVFYHISHCRRASSQSMGHHQEREPGRYFSATIGANGDRRGGLRLFHAPCTDECLWTALVAVPVSRE